MSSPTAEDSAHGHTVADAEAKILHENSPRFKHQYVLNSLDSLLCCWEFGDLSFDVLCRGRKPNRTGKGCRRRREIRLQAYRDAEAHFQQQYNYIQRCYQARQQQMLVARQQYMMATATAAYPAEQTGCGTESPALQICPSTDVLDPSSVDDLYDDII